VLQDNTTRDRDAWGCIRFHETDPNVMIYVDRCCMHYLDTRVRNKLNLFIFLYNYKFHKLLTLFSELFT